MGFSTRAREYAQRALKMFLTTPPVNKEENQMLETVSKFLEDLVIEEEEEMKRHLEFLKGSGTHVPDNNEGAHNNVMLGAKDLATEKLSAAASFLVRREQVSLSRGAVAVDPRSTIHTPRSNRICQPYCRSLVNSPRHMSPSALSAPGSKFGGGTNRAQSDSSLRFHLRIQELNHATAQMKPHASSPGGLPSAFNRALPFRTLY